MTGLDRLNALPVPEAEEALVACCAAPAWTRRVVEARPYPGIDALIAAGDAAFAALTWADITAAVAAHPRIGRSASGGGQDAAWSRREQAAAAATADPATAEVMAELNRAYERRFGHVFLVFASGLSSAEILAAGRERLHNDEERERDVVRGELAKIVRLRLERLAG